MVVWPQIKGSSQYDEVVGVENFFGAIGVLIGAQAVFAQRM